MLTHSTGYIFKYNVGTKDYGQLKLVLEWRNAVSRNNAIIDIRSLQLFHSNVVLDNHLHMISKFKLYLTVFQLFLSAGKH